MQSDLRSDEPKTVIERIVERVPVQDCPQCGFSMTAIRGSKDAICSNCGFKDSCCY
jgi:predicted RNA-binding Zn-ribbon protein involved in translation (DUF1610 family)